MTEVKGIFQGDIIVRTAIIMGLSELRRSPELIDDALAGLLQDNLTANVYGEKTVAQCKDWFLGTDVPVKLGINIANLKTLPVIALEIGNGFESESTLGDKHYVTSEPDPSGNTNKRVIESVHADETYTVAMFVQGEPEYVLFLNTLVMFALLRGKQDLLEARGFEVSKFQYGVVGALAHQTLMMDNVFTRAITLTGKVFHSWPAKVGKTIQSTEFGVKTAPDAENPFGADWADTDILSGVKS